MADHKGRVLIVAGSDSGGGAGIQADIKTVTALGGYAATSITAITVQNTLGVHGVHSVPVDMVDAQARAVLDDIGADVIKTGMLGTAELVNMLADLLADYPDIPLVLDPVMVATSGDVLIDDPAVVAIRDRLIPRAALITPNAPEAAKLTDLQVATTQEQVEAGQKLVEMGAEAALVKGGHLSGRVITDVLVTASSMTVFESERQDTRNTHGTGCTLASAIATGLAGGAPLATAIESAGQYLSEAIRRAPGLGSGHGPVDHGWVLRSKP
jgi:hydroxymethylpyrimidine/phosphomethylpyrimidine kinase